MSSQQKVGAGDNVRSSGSHAREGRASASAALAHSGSFFPGGLREVESLFSDFDRPLY